MYNYAVTYNTVELLSVSTMARAIQALIPQPPITGNPSFRRLSQLPSPAYSPFSGTRSNTLPLILELCSASRMRSFRASAKSLQVPSLVFSKFYSASIFCERVNVVCVCGRLLVHFLSKNITFWCVAGKWRWRKAAPGICKSKLDQIIS